MAVPADQDAHDHDTHGEFHRGEMEIAEQRSTYDVFMGLTKWGSLVVAALLVFLVLLFAVGAGFLSSLLLAAALAGAGVYFMREKKPGSDGGVGGSPARPH